MTFIPLFSFYTFFFAARSPQPLPVQLQTCIACAYKDTTKWWKNKVFRGKQTCAQKYSFPPLPTMMASPGRKPSQSASVGRVQLPHRGRWHRAAMTERVPSPFVRRILHTKMPPEGFAAALRGHPMYVMPWRTRLAFYSISIKFGFSGRAFVCCGAGSWMCRTPSSNFAWMSSFFTSPT